MNYFTAKSLAFFTAILYNASPLLSQENLVGNGSFEAIAFEKPKSWSFIGSVDFYRNGSLSKNSASKQTGPHYPVAAYGKNYIGIRSFYNATEVAATRLSTPLQQGEWYEIGCYVLAPQVDCRVPTACISVVLSDTFPKSTNWYGYDGKNAYTCLASNAGDVIHPKDSALEWQAVSYLYQAKGGERFIWIGNFGYSSSGNALDKAPPPDDGILRCNFQYYYDSVYVFAVPKAPEKAKVFNNLVFARGEGLVDSTHSAILLELYRYMLTYKNCRVELNGHTDNDGQTLDNMRLSLFRASSAANWLFAMGINQNRVKIAGCGESKPLASGPANKALNRRVEIVIRN